MILVIAENYQQALRWSEKYSVKNKDWTYLGSSTQACGHMRPVVVRTGTWWRHPSLTEIEQRLLPTDPIYLEIS